MENLTRNITTNLKKESLKTLQNPDVLFGKSGVNVEVFEEMLQDAHVYAKLEQLKDRVLSMQWDVVSKSSGLEADKVRDFVKAQLSSLGVKQLMQDMLMAVEYGFSVVEVVWNQVGDKWFPAQALGRRPDRFVFTESGGLAVREGMKSLPLDEELKFILHRHNRKNENPYGTPVLSKCYWPWMFKKSGFRYWLTVAEKYGVPTVLALFDSIDDVDAKGRAKELAENLYNIQNDAAVALSNVDSVQVLEARGTSKDFSELIQICNNEISKAITGEILTGDTGGSGSYALAKQHLETLQVKSSKLAKSVAETISATIVKWIVDLNFGNGLYPEFIVDVSVEAEWDVIKDAENLGYDIDRAEVAKRFGIPVSSLKTT